MERRRQMALILFSCIFLALRRQVLISAKVMTLSLWIQQQLLLSPFFLMSRMIFLIWCLLNLGKASCFLNYNSWMNQTSLLRSSTTRQTISSFTPYSIGIPLQRFRPTVEMYLRGSMVEGQMKLRNPTKSIFSLYPYSPKRIFTSSSVLTMRFSSSICRMCLRVMSPSPREMQLKSASGWKSARVVMASRYACRTFSCCSNNKKQAQMLLKISPSLNSPFLLKLYLFITTILLQPLHMHKNRRVVIINADDLGCNQHIDRGIIQLITKKCINSTSVLVNAPNASNAAKELRNSMKQAGILETEVSIGLHFNLTEGKPLSKAILGSKLVENGEFIGKPRIFQVAQQPQAFTPTQIAEELEAQVKMFIELFGMKPSHIDGHNHVHIIPTIATVTAKTMNQLAINKTRIPLEKLQVITLPINHQFLHFASISKQIYANYGIISPRSFVGLQNFGNLSPGLLRKAIQEQKQDVSVEMMCHPGFPATEGSQWVMSTDRLKEMQQLQTEFQEFRGEGNYHHLPNRQQLQE